MTHWRQMHGLSRALSQARCLRTRRRIAACDGCAKVPVHRVVRVRVRPPGDNCLSGYDALEW